MTWDDPRIAFIVQRCHDKREVCRKYYVHPALPAAYQRSLTAPLEPAVLQFLHESVEAG